MTSDLHKKLTEVIMKDNYRLAFLMTLKQINILSRQIKELQETKSNKSKKMK